MDTAVAGAHRHRRSPPPAAPAALTTTPAPAPGPIDCAQVALVYQDLRAVETYLQIFDALEQLERVVDKTFSTISSRVATEQQRLDAVTTKVNNADAKVNWIKQNMGNKATTVHSPAKYPAPAEPTRYAAKSVFCFCGAGCLHVRVRGGPGTKGNELDPSVCGKNGKPQRNRSGLRACGRRDP